MFLSRRRRAVIDARRSGDQRVRLRVRVSNGIHPLTRSIPRNDGLIDAGVAATASAVD